jgi:hypothetical protein
MSYFLAIAVVVLLICTLCLVYSVSKCLSLISNLQEVVGLHEKMLGSFLNITRDHNSSLKSAAKINDGQNDINKLITKQLGVHTKRLDHLLDSYQDIIFILASKTPEQNHN